MRLATDRGFPIAAEPFAREGDGWTLRIAGAARSTASSTRSRCSGPTARTSSGPIRPTRCARRARSARSRCVELPGYAAPAWLGAERVPGATDSLTVASSALGAELDVAIWRPEDARDDEPLPLLVAHDGPELDQLARLTDYSAAHIASGALPRHRVALARRPAIATSGTRRARCTRARSPPACCPRSPTRSRCAGPVGAGVSLGALAMLHAQRRFPDAFAGLFLQSGSFFMPRFDAQESGFVRYRRIVRFVRSTLREQPRRTVPVAMTCGALEENAADNRVMARALAAQGYPVGLRRGPRPAQLHGVARRVGPAPDAAAAARHGDEARAGRDRGAVDRRRGHRDRLRALRAGRCCSSPPSRGAPGTSRAPG